MPTGTGPRSPPTRAPTCPSTALPRPRPRHRRGTRSTPGEQVAQTGGGTAEQPVDVVRDGGDLTGSDRGVGRHPGVELPVRGTVGRARGVGLRHRLLDV